MKKWKKHNLCSNWQIVFMSDPNKQTQFIPFNDDWRKGSIFEEAVFNFEMRNIIAFLLGYGLFNLGIILKRYFGDWSFKFYKSSKVFCTNACVAETPILALQKVPL